MEVVAAAFVVGVLLVAVGVPLRHGEWGVLAPFVIVGALFLVGRFLF